MNKVLLIGNLTRDPETATTNNNNICKFSIAVNRRGKDNGADFINITCFSKTAELCQQYLAKGRKVAICGRISTGSYENKEGKKVYTTDIIADEVEFLSFANAEAPQKQEDITSLEEFKGQPLTEDLPF